MFRGILFVVSFAGCSVPLWLLGVRCFDLSGFDLMCVAFDLLRVVCYGMFCYV